MKAILETRDLVKYYGKGDNLVKAIDHTDLIIEPGEFTAIVGRSGSGKSTLLHMLGGLDRPDSGKVLIEGRDIFQLKDIKLQADALNPTYIKAFLDTVILYYTTTTPLFRSTPSLLLRYVLPHDNKDPSSSEGNYVPEFSAMFWDAFLFQSLLWQRCAEVHVE